MCSCILLLEYVFFCAKEMKKKESLSWKRNAAFGTQDTKYTMLFSLCLCSIYVDDSMLDRLFIFVDYMTYAFVNNAY